MTTVNSSYKEVTSEVTPAECQHSKASSRTPLRRRLVDVEHGVRSCLRSGSAIFIHLFFATLTFSAAFVLNLPLLYMLMLLFCLMSILAAELFHYALTEVLDLIEEKHQDSEQNSSEEDGFPSRGELPCSGKGFVSASVDGSASGFTERYQNARCASIAAVTLTILFSSVMTIAIFYIQIRDFF